MGIAPHVKRLREAVGNELLILPSVSGAIFDSRQRLLLVQQADSREWTTPGGAIDPGETPADAMVREVWEETGLEIEPVGILGVYGGPDCLVVYPNGDQVEYTTTVFRCEIRGGNLLTTTEETIDARYIAQDQLAGYKLSRWAQILLEQFFDDSPTSHFQPARWRPLQA